MAADYPDTQKKKKKKTEEEKKKEEGYFFFFLGGGGGILAGFTTRGSPDETWRGQGIRNRSVLEFAKTESIVTVQRKFQTMYHTESPTDKTIREWYMKFQQSGCLCAAK